MKNMPRRSRNFFRESKRRLKRKPKIRRKNPKKRSQKKHHERRNRPKKKIARNRVHKRRKLKKRKKIKMARGAEEKAHRQQQPQMLAATKTRTAKTLTV